MIFSPGELKAHSSNNQTNKWKLRTVVSKLYQEERRAHENITLISISFS